MPNPKLICAIIFGILLVVIFSSISNNSTKIVLNSVKSDKYKQEAEVYNPILYGVDSKERPYNVAASKAIQVSDGVVKLQTITAELIDKGDKWFAANAQSGELNNANLNLDLLGNVEIFSADGSEMRSSNVNIDLKDSKMKSNEIVEIISKSATLVADRFEAEDQGKKANFYGNVRMVLYPKKN